MKWFIRDAVPSDCPAILQLIKGLAVFEGRPESVVSITPEVLQRDGFGEDQWFHCLVAEQEVDSESNVKDNIVGYALYYPTYSTRKGRMLYLETLYVEPNMRKKGIGMAFFSKLSKIAVEKKCYKIKWSVSDVNQGAIDFYKKLGTEIEEEWKTAVFSFNGRLFKQIDGCSMENPLSPVLANIFMSKKRRCTTTPANFLRPLCDDCFSIKNKDQPDDLLHCLNDHNPNISFTVEENPNHFLDTKFEYTEGKFNCSVYRKPGKMPTYWYLEIPIKWKKNGITGALHRANNISTNFKNDVNEIKETFNKAEYPKGFINHTVKTFMTKIADDDDYY